MVLPEPITFPWMRTTQDTRARPADPEWHPPKRLKVLPAAQAAAQARLAEAQNWILANPVPNTDSTYSSCQLQWHEFCQRHGIRPLEATEAEVVLFMKELQERGLAVGTINSVALSAIAAEHKLISSEPPTRSGLVREAKRVVARIAKQPGPGKRPLLASHVRDIVAQTGERQIEIRDAFLVTLMMAAFLRESEAADLLVEHVWLEVIDGTEVLFVLIKKSKTSPQNHTVVVGAATANPAVCPIQQYKRWMRMRNPKAKYLFHQCTGKRTAKLGHKTPCGILKKLLERIFVDPKEFGSHSCRKGGCTAAAQAGVKVRILKRHGNWKSDAVFLYIHESLEEKLSVSRAIF